MIFSQKIKKIFSLALLLWTLAMPCFAIDEIAENSTLELQDCINLAIKNSPKINMSKNYALAAKSRIGQAKSDYFPTLGAGTGYYGQADSSKNMSGNSNYYSANASLNQMIYNFGKTNARINMQKFSEIAAKHDVDDAIVQAVYDVKSAYYGVLSAQAKRDIQIANVQINERQYLRTKAYFEEGTKSKIDLVNAEVYLSDAKIQLVQAENDLKTAMVKLNNAMYVAYAPDYSIKNTETFNFTTEQFTPISLISDNPDEKYDTVKYDGEGTIFTTSVQKTDLLSNYQFKPYPYTLEEAIKRANEQRPDLLSFAATYAAMEESLKYVKREYYPSINGKVGYTHRNTNYFVNNGMSFSASLDFPTVNIMNTVSKIEEARAQLDAALDNVNLSKQNIYFEVQNAYINMQQIEKRIPLLEVKVRQTLENFELADGRYAVGVGDFIQLQDAKQNYNNAQQSYVQAVFDYNMARASLEKAMGER